MVVAKHIKGSGMNRSKAEAMVTRLLTNAAALQYGSVSVTANIHTGRIVSIVYSVTENIKETETKEIDAGETTTGQ